MIGASSSALTIRGSAVSRGGFSDRVSVHRIRLRRTGLVFSSHGARICSHVSSISLHLGLTLAGKVSSLKMRFRGGGVLF